MSFLKEFSYSEVAQRKILHFNVFVSSMIIGCVLTDLTLYLQYHFFYSPVITILVIFSLGGFFFGNIAGRILFRAIPHARPLYIITELIFVFLSASYLSRMFFPDGGRSFLLDLFFMNQYVFVLFIVASSFIIGMKYNYFMKIACGDFIDDSQGLVGLVVLSLVGFPIGALLAGGATAIPELGYGFILMPLMALPTAFLIKLGYNPPPQYAKEFEREVELDRKKVNYRDTLLFTYLNFGLIILFYFMGLLTFNKFYGSLSVNALFFHTVSFVCIAVGIVAAGRLKKGNWYIYGEMLFPLFFLLFIFVMYYMKDHVPPYAGIVFFFPVAMVIGFILRKTLDNVIAGYNHTVRFSILGFAFFVLPAPLILSIQLIEFTNFWYFIVVYILTLVSILVPGFHLLSRANNGYRKLLFLGFLLAVIPLLIFLHVFFRIPMDGEIYTGRVENFESLKEINYNELFIKQRATVRLFASPVFRVSDSIIRNLKRAAVPLSLYVDEGQPVLFIDGNHRFFQNQMIGIYKNVLSLDVLSDENVDYNKLPLTGSQTYITENEDLLYFLRRKVKGENRFFAIIDMPNIADQQRNRFRFSGEYYGIIRKGIVPGGIFGQVYSLHDCRGDFFAQSVKNLKKAFRSHVVYLFSDHCLILASDRDNAFSVDRDEYARFASLFKGDSGIKSIFLNEIHVLSHLVFTDIDHLVPYLNDKAVIGDCLLSHSGGPALKGDLNGNVMERNDLVLETIDTGKDYGTLKMNVSGAIAANKTAVDFLKRLEYAESIDDYENETKYLFELQKYMAYRIELRDYVSQIFSYKEKYYYNTALRFEKEKKWEDAKKLYNVVLSINSDNFDANYRMGLLYITLQDINNSFKYFNNAQRLKSDHPKVLYQMGVLYFLSNKTNEAIDYFNRSLARNEVNPSLFKYLGMCYEKTGNDIKAQEYYERAVLNDPNDSESRIRLDTIKKKREDERKQWDLSEQKSDVESEQGIEIPLPINKSAYDIRIKDNDKSIPLLESGETVNSTGGK